MVGITRYGLYVPYNRLDRAKLSQVFKKKAMTGEKAVANYDEDSFTLAVSAAQNCLGGGKSGIDLLYFASTTAPDLEKQAASHIAGVLDMEGTLRAGDFAGSLRAGASAMLAAVEAAQAGKTALVAVADTRLGAADGKNEELFGDGAAAFTFGSADVVAEYIDSHSVSYDFYDTWRTVGEKYPHSFEEKYAIEMAYEPFLLESIRGLLEKTGLTPDQIARVVIDGSSLRYSSQVLRKAGFDPAQAQPELMLAVGYTGAAYAPMLLTCALENSKPGDLILYVSYGEGSDAILLKAREGCDRPGLGRGLAYFLANKDSSINYEMYLKWKKMLDFEPPRRAATLRSSLSDFYRNRKKNLALYGSACTECGTPHYPPCRICINCHSIDKMEAYPFQGKGAKLATFTFDYVVFSENAPNIVAVVDFAEGGRIFTQMTDCRMDELAIGMPVEMVYRKLFSADGIHTYSWKCVPAVSR